MMDFNEVVRRLESGEIRVAEPSANGWKVNAWIKETILEGFRQGKLTDMSKDEYSFFDKDTLPLRKFALEDKVRIVPGGSSVRCGAYLAPSVIMMPPSYVNIGAYVDEGTMIDSHALVGSCAQIGRNVCIGLTPASSASRRRSCSPGLAPSPATESVCHPFGPFA